MSKFEHVKVGDAVGMVDGPGVYPTDNIGVVIGKGEDRWGEYVLVIRPDGSRDRIMNFTMIGIGIYHLPTYLVHKMYQDMIPAA